MPPKQECTSLAGFYNAEDHKQKVTINSLEVYGIGAPGIRYCRPVHKASTNYTFLSALTRYDPLRFPLSSRRSGSSRHTGYRDIHLRQESKVRIISLRGQLCFRDQKIRYTRSIIDSVACPLEEITNMDTENLSIFFHVSTEPEPGPAR